MHKDPYLHPFIKLHELNYFIRSFIKFKITPSYNLVKYFDSLLKEKLNTVTDTSIKNTYGFV